MTSWLHTNKCATHTICRFKPRQFKFLTFQLQPVNDWVSYKKQRQRGTWKMTVLRLLLFSTWVSKDGGHLTLGVKEGFLSSVFLLILESSLINRLFVLIWLASAPEKSRLEWLAITPTRCSIQDSHAKALDLLLLSSYK